MDINQPIIRVLFTLIKNNPGLTMFEINSIMEQDPRYKPASGRALIYKMLKEKHISRDKRRAFFTLATEYVPVAVVKKKRAPAVKIKPVKAKPVSPEEAQKEWERTAAIIDSWAPPEPVAVPVLVPARATFARRLINKPVSVPVAFAMSVSSFLAARYLT